VSLGTSTAYDTDLEAPRLKRKRGRLTAYKVLQRPELGLEKLNFLPLS
jgi:hypothetical protein